MRGRASDDRRPDGRVDRAAFEWGVQMGGSAARDVRNDRSHDAGDLYFPWFDWLRAACACVVMWYHGHVLPWNQSGNFGVQVFFALSGWLIGGILLKSEPRDLTRFYFNRAVR